MRFRRRNSLASIAALSGFDVDALAWRTAVVGAGGTVSDGRMALVTTCIQSLKSNGVWTLLDRLWLLAAENSTAALIDLVARATATAVNSPTFTADQGYAGNGTTSYVDTGYNISTATNFKQDNAHFGEWRRTKGSQATFRASGLINAGATAGTFIEAATGNAALNGPSANSSFSNVSEVGHYGVNRSVSTAFVPYLNGAAQASVTNTSSAPVNLTYWLGSRNFNGSTNQQHDGQYIAFHAGASLSAAQWLAFYNALNTYKTAVGA